ncbi:hypothetical protein OHC33_001490 [Knufia fluminis]|uniref:LON peptidase N-terminal domain and RING finger protein 1 n=1 Tax=Knufia fluminis TaxID=191047 RepID=A0AAN8EZD9_9EURO|nr:hypothetical protein OHC33_001490 [Knufia fluminis]
MPRSRVSTGGHIASAFLMADAGELNYHSELAFTPLMHGAGRDIKTVDAAVAENLTETVRAELECHVCYCLMVDPLTTSCGHTFCRKCVARVLDHSTLCPACRRPLSSMRPGVSTEPSNKRISHIIDGLLAEELAARILSIQEEETIDEDGWMALFPCTLAYPGMPTFLHIFEPRYRLMVRRAVENGSRKFGMMMYNAQRLPQGNLGRSQYMQYGTALHILRIEAFPDGRSLLEARGSYRFRVLEGSMVDGYHVGRIQRIDDMPLAEEEAAEALETSGPEPAEIDFEARINHMSTNALLEYGLGFIQQARSRSADWLHERVLAAYGQPPTDAANFPFWFASVLPINDDEKYQLLPTTSVRERLKMTARWIKVLEEARCASERFMRLARPLEPELEGDEAAQSQSEEATPPATPETEAAETESANSYQADADDPQTTSDGSSPQSQAQSPHPENDRTQN